MACISTMTKKGTILSHNVLETVEEIWMQLNYKCTNDNMIEPQLLSHDFILCTTAKGNMILQKRFIHSVE